MYVSRDVTFDEQVFPFASMRPNAGPTLKAKISLHPTLFPTHRMGDSTIDGSMVNSPNAFDVICSSFGVTQQQQATEDPGSTPEAPTAPVPASAMETMPIIGVQESAPNPEADTLPARSPDGESRTSKPAGVSCLVSILDPAPGSSAAGGEQTVADQTQTQDSAPNNNKTSTSSAPSGDTVQPRTRLQGGIRKPKIYIDGPIKYSLLKTTGEPHNLEEALHNRDWKQTMDEEF
jgi:hypothetical protein